MPFLNNYRGGKGCRFMVAFVNSFFRLFINFLFSVAAVTIFGGPRPKETGNQRTSIAMTAGALFIRC